MTDVVLAGDIGGTNCRLALAAKDGQILARAAYTTDNFPSPDAAIAAFLAQHPGLNARWAGLAIAGPISGEIVRLTNTLWVFDAKKLQADFKLDRLTLVNDLQAQARAVADLKPEHLHAVPGGGESLVGPISIVGPGTGLGVALLDPARRPSVAPTEGGHVGFAPHDDLELELLRLWRPHLGRATNEHVVSGPGLVRVYRALGALLDRHVEAIEGPDIMRRGLSGDDPHCVETIDRFARILGGVAGDVVLAQGAHSLVLVGGIVNSLIPILDQGAFRARLQARGPSGAYLTGLPAFVATPGDLGLIGAQALLNDALKHDGAP